MSLEAPPEIVLEDVYKSFDHAALQGVNLTIRRGEMVALVGWAGSGKTVLLRVISGHFRPDRGRVLVADHESEGSPIRDLAALSDTEMDRIRGHWALVFQGNASLGGTVYENLAVFPRELLRKPEVEIQTIARRALTDAGLEPEAVLDKDCASLSTGMAKLVAIARALMLDPVLVMYDSPTAGLDPEMAWRIHDLIAATHARRPAMGVARTTVMVTHGHRVAAAPEAAGRDAARGTDSARWEFRGVCGQRGPARSSIPSADGDAEHPRLRLSCPASRPVRWCGDGSGELSVTVRGECQVRRGSVWIGYRAEPVRVTNKSGG